MSKKVAMIFAGQGSQSIGMGKDFYESSALAQEMFAKAGERIGVDFKRVLFEENTMLDQTQYTQPAILLVQMVALALFKERYPNIEASLFLGHSLGEFSALCAAGAIDYVDAIELVHNRGKLMQAACENIEAGMMALVGIEDGAAESACESARKDGLQVWTANYNQDGQIVVAGMKRDLVACEERFKASGAKKAILLNMSVASHCELLTSAQPELQALLESMVQENFTAPVISNVTTLAYATKAEAVKYLVDQLVKPVKYKQSIVAIASDVDVAIEFGNGNVLKGLNKRIAKDLLTLNVSDIASLEHIALELGA